MTIVIIIIIIVKYFYEKEEIIMNGNIKKVFEAVSQETGLRCDDNTSSLLGQYNGYHLYINYSGSFYTIYASARKNGQFPDKELLKNIKKSTSGISSIGIQKNNIMANITGMTTKSVISKMLTALKGLTDALRINGFEDVCEGCGKPVSNIGSYYVGGGITFLCDDCYTNIAQSLQNAEVEMSNTNENFIGGLVGAFLGSVLGLIAIIIIGQLGYVSVVSGLVMGVCTVKGYELMGKKLSAKGIVVCCIFMIFMPYFADKLDWSITISKEFEWSLSDVFQNFWPLIDGADIAVDFYVDLFKVYLFTAVGAIPMMLNIIKSRKVAYNSYKIN